MIEFDFHLQRPGFCLELAGRIPPRGVTALFGHSGCGKTTLLRCLAGLEPEVQGRLSVNGQQWQAGGRQWPPHQRAVGYVFQEGALFPHLTVTGNLHYGYRRVPADARRLQPGEVVELLGLAPLLHRYPHELSGGQRQRVAIGRALLTSPDLLLMDEPLAALDALSKNEILPWLDRLHQTLDIPVVYVTHAIEEVARLADHMLLLEQGRLLAAGPLQSLLTRTDLPLAHADNATSVIETKVVRFESEYHLLHLTFDGGELQVPCTHAPETSTVRIRVAARDVVLSLSADSRGSALNHLPARITGFNNDPHPAHQLVTLTLGDTPLLARITRKSRDQLGLQTGQAVHVQFKAVAIS
ncbi:molybdenum ABC transporter ATP-binding protein [Natronospirillum operosum]|uniref:Molybdenum ABC transporter ATP-binding protein n=1 Tax=Natronospirillum operosum TaxID=2759953 RepID=A0A4Z0WGX8_9GAMM|nr:molybdenum ABC transporter ATP-binding protein [Natronospirillum operosum]TGG93900.1 molybdenum ABC transporter ATP-binding protein [Natronospirillum operosum]